MTLVAPATVKGPTVRHGGLTGDGGCFASPLYTEKKSYIQRRQQRQKKKAERKRNEIRKGDAKKKRTGESGVIKGMGAQYRKAGEGEMQCCVYFSLLAPAPFCCCI